MARPAFLSPPSEYYTELRGDTTDLTRCAPALHLPAAYATRSCLLTPAAAAAGSAAAAAAAAAAATPMLVPKAATGVTGANALHSPPQMSQLAAAAAATVPTAEDMEDAIHSTMEVFISGSSIEPAYELRGELGRGKYGRVFLVEDCLQHRLLAVKATYDPNWIAAVRHSRSRPGALKDAPGSGAARQRGTHEGVNTPPAPRPPFTHISSEVSCMRECNSPFVVRLAGAEKGEHGEDLLLMEYVDCGDLRQEIRRRRAGGHAFNELEVGFIFVQLCMAVDHLHQRNILHHDLKPENILLSSTGIIKLGDFGFARKYAEPVGNNVALTGCGTPYYLSPEALRGERYSLKSEMWALGVILYELMALTGPFLAANKNELRAKVHEGHYVPLPATYSQALRDVCARLLSQNPSHRPSTQELFTENDYVRELLNELRRTSECSAKMTTEEKGAIFFSISAALRRRSPTTPRGVAGGSNCSSWSSSLNNSYGVPGAAATAATAQKTRIEY